MRDEDEEEEWSLAIRKPAKKSKARMVAYPLATHPGISGGAFVVDDIVVGNQIIFCLVNLSEEGPRFLLT